MMKPLSERKRVILRGYTVVELIVVIGTIGVLLALLLPAVQQAREAARRLQCKANLKNIGLALHNYSDAHSAFPFGWDSNGTGWTAMLLPFVDQEPLYSSLIFSADIDGYWQLEGPNRAACETVLPLFRCPSAKVPTAYNLNGIRGRVPCSYLGCASGKIKMDNALANGDQDGMFFGGSSTRFRDILNGASNTLCVGEAINSPDESQDGNVVDHWYIGSPQLRGPAPKECSEFVGSAGVAVNATLDEFSTIDEKELAFSSQHLGGCHCLLADGSTRFFSESIDLLIWQTHGSVGK